MIRSMMNHKQKGGKKTDMKTFLLHWRTGPSEEVYGNDITHALNRTGYGQGALPALDYWEEVKEETSDDNQKEEGGN